MKANDIEMFDVVFRYLQMTGKYQKRDFRGKILIDYVKKEERIRYTVIHNGSAFPSVSKVISMELGKGFHLSVKKDYETGKISGNYSGFRNDEQKYVPYLIDFIMDKLYNEIKDKKFTRTIKT